MYAAYVYIYIYTVYCIYTQYTVYIQYALNDRYYAHSFFRENCLSTWLFYSNALIRGQNYKVWEKNKKQLIHLLRTLRNTFLGHRKAALGHTPPPKRTPPRSARLLEAHASSKRTPPQSARLP